MMLKLVYPVYIFRFIDNSCAQNGLFSWGRVGYCLLPNLCWWEGKKVCLLPHISVGGRVAVPEAVCRLLHVCPEPATMGISEYYFSNVEF